MIVLETSQYLLKELRQCRWQRCESRVERAVLPKHAEFFKRHKSIERQRRIRPRIAVEQRFQLRWRELFATLGPWRCRDARTERFTCGT